MEVVSKAMHKLESTQVSGEVSNRRRPNGNDEHKEIMRLAIM